MRSFLQGALDPSGLMARLALNPYRRAWTADQAAAPRYDAPLLITGCPRTGTSALAECLSMHPNICILHEACLYDQRDARLASRRPLPWEHRSLPSDPVWRGAVGRLQARRATNIELRAEIFDGIRGVKELLVYGDKLPHRYLDQLATLSRRFPRARFLVTVRDGRDVVASQLRAFEARRAAGRPPDWWMAATIGAAEGVWLRAMEQWERVRDRIPPARWLQVEYGESTRDSAATFRRIQAFLGLPDAGALTGEPIARYRPVHAGQWREEFPDLEARVSGSFRRMLRRWGYA